MFDLEKAIAGWREQMLAAGVQSPVPLDELESHLREDLEQRTRAGVGEAEAFENAVQQIDRAMALRKEFMKNKNLKELILRKLKTLIPGVREMPVPALDNFEPEARRTLAVAPDEARHLNHDFVGTEHLLLGLTRCGSKSVVNVMQKLGVKSDVLRLEIERLVTTGPIAVTAEKIPYTPRARQALQLAAEEAGNLNQSQVKPEHIFLGLLREGGGVAALVLKNLGVHLATARAAVLAELNANPATN